MTNKAPTINMLPENAQRQLYDELAAKFAPVRMSAAVPREAKVKAATTVLQAVSAFTMPEQRTILRFAIDVLELAGDHWWRKPKPTENTKGDQRE